MKTRFFGRFLLEVLLGSVFSFGVGERVYAIEVGQTLELPVVRLLDGRTPDRAEGQGKHTLIQIWASWCPFCKRQNAYLQSLVQKIPAQSLNILTISIDKSAEVAQQYISDHRYSFPVTMMTPELNAALGRMRGIPILLMLDPANKVVLKEVGEMFEEDFAELSRYAR